MRIIFAGTPEIAVPSLIALAKEHEVCGVVTNPDRPQGRKKNLVPSPVKYAALDLNIPIYQPEKLSNELYKTISELKPDILVCIAFGKILKKEFLDIFPNGGLNLHPSLLPKYRGASPINEAILNGDKVSGISIQRLAKKVDSGNILFQKEFTIGDFETAGELTDRVAIMSAPYIVEVVNKIESGNFSEWEQDHDKATFCTLIKKDDGLIDWNSSSERILNTIRAYSPWPLAQTIFEDKKLNIISGTASDIVMDGNPGDVLEYSKQNGFLVKTGDGTIYLTALQLQSKKALDYKSFNNGVQKFVGSHLG